MESQLLIQSILPILFDEEGFYRRIPNVNMGKYVEPQFRDNEGAYYVEPKLLERYSGTSGISRGGPRGAVESVASIVPYKRDLSEGQLSASHKKIAEKVRKHKYHDEHSLRADLMIFFRDITGYLPTDDWSTQELQFVVMYNKWPLGGTQKDYQKFNNKISKVRLPRRGGSKKRKNKISRRKKKSKYKKKKSRGKRKKMSKVSIKKK